jgi:hypothetical protein
MITCYYSAVPIGPKSFRPHSFKRSNTITLCWQNGKVSITDGSYVETKEQLGGILALEAGTSTTSSS